jgi:LysR family glycine cleavage system transcriptional activator
MAAEAAIRGEGWLGRSVLVTDDIAAGCLVTPLPQIQFRVKRGYHLVCRNGRR